MAKKKAKPRRKRVRDHERSQWMKDLWATPEYREKVTKALTEATRERVKDHTKTRYGIPNGMRREEAEYEWSWARFYADKVVKIMKEENILPKEESPADEATREALTVLRAPVRPELKIAAARLILDFHKAKPQSKSEVTVKSAEDWLSSVTADHFARKPVENVPGPTAH